MAIVCIAPFDVQHLTGSRVRIDVSNSITASSYIRTTGAFFTCISASIEDIDYNHFGNDFTSWLSANNFGRWSFTYSMASASYTLNSESGSGAKFIFTSSDNGNAYRIFGMSNGSTLVQTSYTSTNRPYFLWQSTLDAWTKISQPYEGESNLVRAEDCDDGRTYSISKEDGVYWLSDIPGNYTFMDWTFALEDRANMFTDFSSSYVPYTWQDHIAWVRSYKPFVVFEFNTASNPSYDDRRGTYKIRAAKSAFQPKTSFDSLYSYWNIDVDTRELSQGRNFGYNVITNSYGSISSPLEYPGCIVWLRADQGVITNSSNQVMTWSNLAGSHIFTASSTLQAPTYNTAVLGLNNRPALNFFSNSLSGSKLLSSVSTVEFLSAEMTAFYVFNRTGSSTSFDQTIVETSPAEGSNTGSFAFWSSTGTSGGGRIFPRYNSGSGNTSFTSSAFIPLNIVSLRAKTFNFGTNNTAGGDPYTFDKIDFYSTASGSWQPLFSSSYETGTSVFNNYVGGYTVTASVANLIQSKTMYIGARADRSLWLSGNLAEIIFYNRALAEPEITAVQNYLTERYI